MTTPNSTLTVIPRPREFDPKATGHCGRPTTSRGPCRLPRRMVSGAAWYESVFEAPLLQWEMGGCNRHLTEAEQAFVDLAERLGRTEMALLEYKRENDVLTMFRSDKQPLPPACWKWSDVDRLARERGYPVPEVADLASLEAWHQGKCAICGELSALVYDHDHWSGLVRGLLCWTCNSAEARHHGIYAMYRDRHPAKLFGLRIPYSPGMRPETTR